MHAFSAHPHTHTTKDEDPLVFSGKRQLLEYNLVKETIDEVVEDNVTKMKVLLKFVNLYKYYTMNAFLPSLMMVAISYATLSFHLDDFQASLC
ncbi:hypothetical protein Pcinc_005211 [Petrolisthes cinctipes]|uniref:Uncharacterized protein n=1 Tax=Petrolisthes cinctipes TaxID=88211 RepID=A0AAE1GD78_PETCI|nr:hypothetical protein Pcinc_005211 [Petrolisthes cinctipes]